MAFGFVLLTCFRAYLTDTCSMLFCSHNCAHRMNTSSRRNESCWVVHPSCHRLPCRRPQIPLCQNHIYSKPFCSHSCARHICTSNLHCGSWLASLRHRIASPFRPLRPFRPYPFHPFHPYPFHPCPYPCLPSCRKVAEHPYLPSCPPSLPSESFAWECDIYGIGLYLHNCGHRSCISNLQTENRSPLIHLDQFQKVILISHTCGSWICSQSCDHRKKGTSNLQLESFQVFLPLNPLP